MGEIVQAVQRVATIMDSISVQSGTQANEIDQVALAIQSVDSATQENAALVEETSASAAGLQQLAAELVKVVESFTLSEESGKVSGLDFRVAIEAHEKWKQRLDAVISGRSSEKLDYQTVCRDDLCVLGKWLHGPGRECCSKFEVFTELVNTHAQFHKAAGEVLQAAQQGRKDEARNLMHRGAFPQCSSDVRGLLSRMFLRITTQANEGRYGATTGSRPT
jgi:methyl-accepting chemotaxis protein